MKKLSTFLFTILFLGITFTSVSAYCQDFAPITISNLAGTLQYADSSGTTQSITLNNPTLIENFRSIYFIRKRFQATLDLSYDYLDLTGSWTFYSPLTISGDPNESNHDFLPTSLPAPFLHPSNTYDTQVYCEVLSVSMSDVLPSFLYTLSTGTRYDFVTYDYTVRCPMSGDFLDVSDQYSLEWWLAWPTSNVTEFNTLLRAIGFFSNIRTTALLSKNICTPADVTWILNDLNENVIDVSDRIEEIDTFMHDTDVSNSILGAEDFFDDHENELEVFGLADFVSAGINFIRSIYFDYACVPLQLPALLGTQITLPCFTEWLRSFDENFYNLYKMVLYFYVAYLICSDLIHFVHKLRDPQDDNITILDI